MKKFLVLIIIMMFIVSIGSAYAIETIVDIDNYKELSFNSFDGETLELEVIGNYKVNISFSYYIPWDEVLRHEMSTYYYNIDTDILIIVSEDGEIIYSDLEL